MADNAKKSLSTAQLLTMIRRSANFDRVDAAVHNASEEGFCQYLYRLMTARNLKPKDVVTESGLERSYFYHILSGKKLPLRNVVLRISLCIGASYQETNKLLLLASQGALYPRVRRDAALIYCIEHKYTMSEANDFLKSLGETALYKDG